MRGCSLLDTIGSYRYGTVRLIVKGQYFYNCAILNRHPALEDYKVIELSGKVEELMWLPPAVFPVSSSHGAVIGSLRHALVRVAPMMYRIPFADPSPDRNDHCGEPKLPAPPAIIRKATFQWPPDCVWPFTDRASNTDT